MENGRRWTRVWIVRVRVFLTGYTVAMVTENDHNLLCKHRFIVWCNCYSITKNIVVALIYKQNSQKCKKPSWATLTNPQICIKITFPVLMIGKKRCFRRKRTEMNGLRWPNLIGRPLKILPRQESLLLCGQSLIQSLLAFWSASSVCLLTKQARVLCVRHSCVF